MGGLYKEPENEARLQSIVPFWFELLRILPICREVMDEVNRDNHFGTLGDDQATYCAGSHTPPTYSGWRGLV